MTVTLSTALRLFLEANDFETEKTTVIDPSSEIRRIANDTFGHATAREIKSVCSEIFRVVAVYSVAFAIPSKTVAIALLEARIKELETQNGLLQVENTRLVLARQEVEARIKL